MELNKVYNGDCLELMKAIPDGSIDMVCCDLPYEMLNRGNPDARWDKMIPFEPLWKQYERIVKSNGAIVLFSQGMFTARLMLSNEKLWRYNLVWDKSKVTGFLNARRMPLKQTEIISVCYRKLPTYNPQMRKCEPHQRNHQRGKQENITNRCYGDYGKAEDIISDEKYPTDLICFLRNVHTDNEHPTQKPVELIRWLMRTYTNEGETVLDNCCGSGTTGVAAIKEKRNFICMERDQKYFETAKRRIAKELQQPTLF